MTQVRPVTLPPSSFGKRREPPRSALPCEIRNATRATLLIRSGKLICESGEYVCLVRDVSSGGVRLRLFHAVPPGPCFLLETADGASFSMELRWCRDDEAGFRFADPIDVNIFIERSNDAPRRQMRLRVAYAGMIVSHGRSSPMVLRNISQGGAQIEIAGSLALHQIVRLLICGLPECFAQVRWRRESDYGLAFLHPFCLDELAAYATILQPFGAEPAPAPVESARPSAITPAVDAPGSDDQGS